METFISYYEHYFVENKHFKIVKQASQIQHDNTTKNPKLFEENQPYEREAHNLRIELTSEEIEIVGQAE